ncbi:MAG: spermidine/putrescine ABC transporter substrate-binding protein [Rubrobacter sp.]|nr:spermidine/putrescine ABC transporter substrate-binding protein [Rubrobacter sp.]MDQ3375288.1 spermidine/putrescine ABC transporter substrate-binding protein [Actinomycetota bacterium]
MKRISRGRFLRTMGAAGVAGSTLSVLACQPNTSAQSGGGDGGPEEKVLNFYNWADYVAENTVPDFQKQTGIKVTQDFFSSNEDLLAKLQAGGTGYDVIVPSDYMVAIMIKSDVVQKLDMAQIPNSKNVGKEYKGLSYDPNNEYSLPYQWGTTGILYNKKEIGQLPESWDPLWDTEFEGEMSMLNDTRETLGAALYKLGYSVNATDQGQLEEAKAELKKQNPLLRGYFDSTEARPLVQNGDLLLGHVFSGDAFLALSENEDLDYVIPKPAATRWTDNMCIPNGAEHPQNAHKFINYILDAEVGAELSNYTYYATPNEAALPMIDDALKKLPTYSPTQEQFERLQVIEDTGEVTREYERIFTEVKSS